MDIHVAPIQILFFLNYSCTQLQMVEMLKKKDVSVLCIIIYWLVECTFILKLYICSTSKPKD